MASMGTCAAGGAARGTTFMERLNSPWHKRALQAFMVIVLAHWAEHLMQAVQIYAWGWPIKESRGVLGWWIPWLATSEALHYFYAIVMLIGIWLLRTGFVGRSKTWWMIAFWIQFWHHIEHALLQGQVLYGANFFGAPAPISVIQMLGFLDGGTAASGFGGMMIGPPKTDWSILMLFVRRVEVHLFYNAVVFIPMVVGMFDHMFPTAAEEAKHCCTCAWHPRPRLAL